MTSNEEKIYFQLVGLYGDELAKTYLPKVIKKIKNFDNKNRNSGKISEKDSILIMYADQVMDSEHRSLRVLSSMLDKYINGIISGIHLLPFFVASSDEGFSVVDYYKVNPNYGTWENVISLNDNYKLMFDAVINHVSSQSKWFNAFLNDDAHYRDYFIKLTPDIDLSQVVRPRALPLLTRFDTETGKKYLWTTFSDDQIDLNYHNPEVLLEIIDILLFYVDKGANYIRLDAIAYAFKEIGTPCIHLAQTHRLVELFRLILDYTASKPLIITETNVPHTENISYFGDGTNEAQLVYNFALPPLVLHGIFTGSASKISDWASKLELPSEETTFFNFLASHDGIGLNPARGILTVDEIEDLVSHIECLGGFISYKDNPNGTRTPYELNINYYDALSDPGDGLPETVHINRFILAHAVLFSFIGLPGIYFHSMFGSRGFPEGIKITGEKRAINRERLTYPELINELSNPEHRRHKIYHQLAKLLKIRASAPGFHPHGSQMVINLDDRIFALRRSDLENKNNIFCLHNFSGEEVKIEVKLKKPLGLNVYQYIDLITKRPLILNKDGKLIFKPYQFYWLAKI